MRAFSCQSINHTRHGATAIEHHVIMEVNGGSVYAAFMQLLYSVYAALKSLIRYTTVHLQPTESCSRIPHYVIMLNYCSFCYCIILYMQYVAVCRGVSDTVLGHTIIHLTVIWLYEIMAQNHDYRLLWDSVGWRCTMENSKVVWSWMNAAPIHLHYNLWLTPCPLWCKSWTDEKMSSIKQHHGWVKIRAWYQKVQTIPLNISPTLDATHHLSVDWQPPLWAWLVLWCVSL